MENFTWQQWFVLVILVIRGLFLAFNNNFPPDYFHQGNRAARIIIHGVFVLALITGGFWK